MSGLPLRILTGERRGFFVGDRPLPTPHRKGNFQYAQTGSASVSVLGEDVKAMVDPTPQPVATGGKFWTANAFRKNSVSPEGGNWQWDSSGFQTAAVRHTSRPGNGSPAILSVSPGGSGEHFYALSFDTGRSPATLSYNPLARSEPRSFVGGQGQLVLGNPVGVIRNRKSKYPVYDRIQVRSQIPNESSIVRTEKNT